MGLTQKLGTIPLAISTDASNNVGIGGSPSGSYKLEVTGTAKVSSTLLLGGALSGTSATFTTSDVNVLNIAPTTGTAQSRAKITNTSGDIYFGIASSTGASAITGTTAYSGYIATADNAKDFFIGTNGVQRFKLDGSTGAATFSSTVQAKQFYGYSTTTTGSNFALSAECTGVGATMNGGLQIYASGGTTNKGIEMYPGYPAAGTNNWAIYSACAAKSYFEGNVLIGTTTENTTVSKLQVKSDAGAQAISVLGRSSDNISQYLFLDNTNATIYGLMQGSSTGGGRVTIIAGGSNGVYLAAGGTSWTSNSDERLKDINSTIENAVDKLMTLRTVNFSWKNDINKKENLGLIAQDVEKVFPQVVNSNKEKDAEIEYLGVSYSDLVPVLVKAIQELSAQNQDLKSRLDKAGL